MNDPVNYERWVEDNAARYAAMGLLGWIMEWAGNAAVLLVMYGIVGPVLVVLSLVSWLIMLPVRGWWKLTGRA